MKKTTLALVAALLAGVFAHTASAQTVIRITGSTAYRSSTHKAIEGILTNIKRIKNNSNLYGSSVACFSGNLNTGNPNISVSGSSAVIIKTYWSGSLAGVADLVQSANLPFMASSVLSSGDNTVTSSYPLDNAPPEVAMSDNSAAEAAACLNTGNAAAKAVAAAISAATLNVGGDNTAAGPCGVVPFVWAVSAVGTGDTSGMLNAKSISQNLAYELLAKGNAPVSSLADSGGNAIATLPAFGSGGAANFLFLVGRSQDSGTRINAFAEPAFSNTLTNGFGYAPKQHRITFTGNTTTYSDNSQTIQTGGAASATLNAIALWDNNWPLNTEPSISWAGEGHSGYIAGGDVRNCLKATGGATITPSGNALPASSFFVPTTSKCYLIGYMGAADANGLTGGIASSPQILRYNGVKYSVANVQSGAYTFWGYEYQDYKSTLAGVQKDTADAIADQILAVAAPTDSNGATPGGDGSAGILYDSNFSVQKSGTGAFVAPY